MKKLAYPLFFLALTFAYFHEFFLSGLLPFWGDGRVEFYPLWVFMQKTVLSGGLPLWNPYMFLGFPMAASMQPAALYPVYYPFFLIPAETGFSLAIILHSFIAAIGAFLFTRQITENDYASFVAGTTYGFLGYMATYLVHVPIHNTAAWLPIILYFIEKLSRDGKLKHAAFASIVIALHVYSGHPQTLLQSMMLITAYILFRAFSLRREGGIAFFFKSAASLAAGVVLAAPQLMATIELTGLAFRKTLTYEQFSQFSFPPHMILSMLFPNFWIDTSGNYWGPDTLIKNPEGFAGILTLTIAIITAIRYFRKNPQVAFWSCITFAAALLALGDNIPFLQHIVYRAPLFSLFRAPVRHFFEISLGLSVLTGIGLGRGLSGDRKFIRTIALTFGLMAVLSVLAVLASGAIFHGNEAFSGLLLKPDALTENLSITNKSLYVPIILMAVYCAVFVFLLRERLWVRRIAIAVISFFLVFEVFYLREVSRHLWTQPAELHSDLADPLYEPISKGLARTAFITDGGLGVDNLPIAEDIYMFNSYDPLILSSLSDLADMEGIGYSHAWSDLLKNNIILSATDTGFISAPKKMSPIIEGIRGKTIVDDDGKLHFTSPISSYLPATKEYQSLYTKVTEAGGRVLYENRNVFPRAYSVERLVPTGGVKDTRSKLYTFRADPRREALLEPADIQRIGQTSFSTGNIVITGYSAQTVNLQLDLPSRGYIVLSDQYYPGWKAYVDGVESKIYKTNTVMRGVVVPAGHHELVFRYIPLRIYISMAVSGILLIAIAIMLIFGRRHSIFRHGPIS